VLTSDPFTVVTSKSTSPVAGSTDTIAAKSIDPVAGKSVDSVDAVTVVVGKSVDPVVTLADAATAKSADCVASASAKSVEAVTVMSGKSVDAMTRSAGDVTASCKALLILSPVPLSNVTSLDTPQSPSPSPKGRVTFSDHVTEIQPGVGSGVGVDGKPRRIPPAPPPRKALKNVAASICPGSPSRPRDRPCSALEPLATAGVDGRPGFSAVNGTGRARPLSMAPLATVDSDSDSSVGTESQTGTVRRNTARSAELRNGARGRTPPPVPMRKTSSLSSSLAPVTKNSDGFLVQDVQYSNLHDVRQECARLELASSQRDGTKADGMMKSEETEIY